MPDQELYVYGAVCTWHGPVSETKLRQIPVCPHCGGPLFQCDSRRQWDERIEAFLLERQEFFVLKGWATPEAAHDLYRRWMQSLHDSRTCVPLKDWDWLEAMRKWGEEHPR